MGSMGNNRNTSMQNKGDAVIALCRREDGGRKTLTLSCNMGAAAMLNLTTLGGYF